MRRFVFAFFTDDAAFRHAMIFLPPPPEPSLPPCQRAARRERVRHDARSAGRQRHRMTRLSARQQRGVRATHHACATPRERRHALVFARY